MKKLLIVLMLAVLVSAPVATFAKGGGGGRGGGGRSSSSSRSSSVRSTPKVSKPSVPKAPKVSTKPSTKTVKVQSATAKKVNGKTFSKKGSVVDDTYKPRFNGGYSAPAGSVVYYRESSGLDWLPFYLIMTSQSHREAVVVEPAKDGQPAVEKVVKEEGVDTMYVVNWVVSILIILGLIGGIVYLVNRKTRNA